MKHFRKELWFNILTRVALVNITDEVQSCTNESSITKGLALVNAMHDTASVLVNEDESGLHSDYVKWLE